MHTCPIHTYSQKLIEPYNELTNICQFVEQWGNHDWNIEQHNSYMCTCTIHINALDSGLWSLIHTSNNQGEYYCFTPHYQ